MLAFLPILAVSLTLDSLIPIIIGLIVLCILLYAVNIILSMISLPAQVKQLIWLLVAVVVLIVVLSALGLIH